MPRIEAVFFHVGETIVDESRECVERRQAHRRILPPSRQGAPPARGRTVPIGPEAVSVSASPAPEEGRMTTNNHRSAALETVLA